MFQVVLPEGSTGPSAVVPFQVEQHLEVSKRLYNFAYIVERCLEIYVHLALAMEFPLACIVDLCLELYLFPFTFYIASLNQRFSQPPQKKYSYLDVVGRTVVVLEKKNLVPEHNSAFQVSCRM